MSNEDYSSESRRAFLKNSNLTSIKQPFFSHTPRQPSLCSSSTNCSEFGVKHEAAARWQLAMMVAVRSKKKKRSKLVWWRFKSEVWQQRRELFINVHPNWWDRLAGKFVKRFNLPTRRQSHAGIKIRWFHRLWRSSTRASPSGSSGARSRQNLEIWWIA